MIISNVFATIWLYALVDNELDQIVESKIAEQIRLTFRDVDPPTFERFLDPIMYVRTDQEPVEFARDIFPCSDLSRIHLYKLDEILSSLTPEAYLYVIPRILIYLLEDESGMDENFYSNFLRMIDINPRNPKMLSVFPTQKNEYFRSQLTTLQRDAITAAFQHLSEHRYTSKESSIIYQTAIDFLKKE